MNGAPWTIIGWAIVVAIGFNLVAVPFVVLHFVRVRRRALEQFERRREGIRRHR